MGLLTGFRLGWKVGLDEGLGSDFPPDTVQYDPPKQQKSSGIPVSHSSPTTSQVPNAGGGTPVGGSS